LDLEFSSVQSGDAQCSRCRAASRDVGNAKNWKVRERERERGKGRNTWSSEVRGGWRMRGGEGREWKRARERRVSEGWKGSFWTPGVVL